MITTRDLAVKWTTYAIVIPIFLCIYYLFFGQLKLWGVAPFLPAVIVAAVSSIEDRYEASLFGMIFGILCDLLLSAPIPCLYTIAFTVTSLLGAAVSDGMMQPGFFRTLVISLLTFAIMDLFFVAEILFAAHGTFSTVLSLALRETLVSQLLLLPVYPLFSSLHRFFTL